MKTKDLNKQNIIILSAIDPTRAYSCIKYLFFQLKKNGKIVVCWCRVPKESMNSYKQWGNNAHSFCNNILGRIPKIRTYYMKLVGLFLCLKYRNCTIICHDLFYYKVCSIVKRFFPKTRLILYFTEIYNSKHSRFLQKLQSYYEKNPNNMDLLIECDYSREKYRINNNKIFKTTDTILNTIPLSEIQNCVKNKKKDNNIPIIVYSGGAHNNGELDILIQALNRIDIEFKAVFYCYGTSRTLKDLRKECEKFLRNKYELIENKPREAVLDGIHNADIGIVYYDPTYSINTQYAAPTKFFEYVGLEIPIVCSGNDSLITLIDKYGLGLYMKDNDSYGMEKCIRELLNNSKLRKDISANEHEAFTRFLCYEQQSKKAILKILNIIENK